MKKIVFLMMVVLLGVCGYAQEGEYVDLGLPSGTKWKTVNEKENFVYDDAVAIFGKELPSKEQWEELKEKCKWVWVDGDGDGDIQSGYYVVGPNGKRIFLPAAGNRYGTDVIYVGPYGHYWSSSYDYEGRAWNVLFGSGNVGMYNVSRYYGRSVRLVRLGVGGYAQEGEYVDLGLPSGTKWKTVNEKGYFKYDAAVAKFGKELPSKEQWEELKEKCNWVWADGDGDILLAGYYVVGPNGKRIFLPAAGSRYVKDAVGGSVGTFGSYWSSSYYNEDNAWGMDFLSGGVDMNNGSRRSGGLSVRLVRKLKY